MRGGWLLVPVLLVAAGAAAWISPSDENGDPTGVVPAGDRNPAADAARFAAGARLVEESICWLERESVSVDRIESFHCRLDAKIEWDWMRLEGPLELWYRAPGGFRREHTSNGGTTTHLLAGGRGWSIDTDGHVEDLRASSEGRRLLADVRETRDRLVDLAGVIALRPMRRETARFRFEGYKRGSGTYAGNWIKLARHAPGARRVTCWLAYDRDDASELMVHATWPGVVRIED